MSVNGHERTIGEELLAAGPAAPMELHTPEGPEGNVPWWLAKELGGPIALYVLLKIRAKAYLGAVRRPRPSYDMLAQELGVNRRTVIDWANKLDKLGALGRFANRRPSGADARNDYVVFSHHPQWRDYRQPYGVTESAPQGPDHGVTESAPLPTVPLHTDSPTLSLGATRGASAQNGGVATQGSLPGIPKPGDQVWADYKAIVNPKAKTKPWREIHNLLRPGRYTVDELRQCMEKWRSSLWHQAGAKTRPPTPKQFFDSEYIERLHALDVQAANVRYKRQQAKERAEAGPGPGIESRWIPPQEQQP